MSRLVTAPCGGSCTKNSGETCPPSRFSCGIPARLPCIHGHVCGTHTDPNCMHATAGRACHPSSRTIGDITGWRLCDRERVREGRSFQGGVTALEQIQLGTRLSLPPLLSAQRLAARKLTQKANAITVGLRRCAQLRCPASPSSSSVLSSTGVPSVCVFRFSSGWLDGGTVEAAAASSFG